MVGSHFNFTDTLFEHNYISTNRGFGGGAIGGSITRTGVPSISNGTRSRFISNTAEKSGGGVYIDFSEASFSQCTFVGNRLVGWYAAYNAIYTCSSSSSKRR